MKFMALEGESVLRRERRATDVAWLQMGSSEVVGGSMVLDGCWLVCMCVCLCLVADLTRVGVMMRAGRGRSDQREE